MTNSAVASAKHPGRPRRSGTSLGAAREEVLNAAAELFTSQGYSATTTRQVADRVGVRQGSIYHHFTSKEAILEELLKGLLTPVVLIAERLRRTDLRDHDFGNDPASGAAARLHALALTDARVLAEWPWNLGAVAFLPEARNVAYNWHTERQRLRDHYIEFSSALSSALGQPLPGDHAFRLVESIISIRTDGQLTAETPYQIAASALALSGWNRPVKHVAQMSERLLQE